MTDKQGVEIDYCPKCRGVWLDRGELDKLIQKDFQFYEERGLKTQDRDRNFRHNYDEGYERKYQERQDKHSKNQYRKKKRDRFDF